MLWKNLSGLRAIRMPKPLYMNMLYYFDLTLHEAMNLASSDNSSGNGRAASRASYGSNSFERINQSQKHE